jgi:hypothetical protein
MKTNHIISGTISTITGSHTNIIRLTSHEMVVHLWLIYDLILSLI